MKLTSVPPLFIALSALFPNLQAGQSASESAPDKSGYNLFAPTPVERMREFNPDRPDKTESPYTVDAGHFQVEMDLATFTQDQSSGVRTQTWNIAPINFKVGLLNNADLQFVFGSYLHQKVEDAAAETSKKTSGAGDLTLRLKVNFWGNEGGGTAFGILPFLKIPTSTSSFGNDAVEGGLIFPFAVTLPSDWDLGMMTECDFLRNEGERGYHAEFVNSVTTSHAIFGALGGYLEFFSSISTHGAWVGTADLGLTCRLTKNIQFDTGCNIGLTRSADDLNPFVGASVRF